MSVPKTAGETPSNEAANSPDVSHATVVKEVQHGKPHHAEPHGADVTGQEPSIVEVATEKFKRDLEEIRNNPKAMGIPLYNRLSAGSTRMLDPTPWVLRFFLQLAGGLGIAIDICKLEQAWPQEQRTRRCDELSADDFCDTKLANIVTSVLEALDERAAVPLWSPTIPRWLEDWANYVHAQDAPVVLESASIDGPQIGGSHDRMAEENSESVMQTHRESSLARENAIATLRALLQDPKALEATGVAICHQYCVGSTDPDPQLNMVSTAVVPASLVQLWHHMARHGIPIDGAKLQLEWVRESETNHGHVSVLEFIRNLLPKIIRSISSVVDCNTDTFGDGAVSSQVPRWLEDWSSAALESFRSSQIAATAAHSNDVFRPPDHRGYASAPSQRDPPPASVGLQPSQSTSISLVNSSFRSLDHRSSTSTPFPGDPIPTFMSHDFPMADAAALTMLPSDVQVQSDHFVQKRYDGTRAPPLFDPLHRALSNDTQLPSPKTPKSASPKSPRSPRSPRSLKRESQKFKDVKLEVGTCNLEIQDITQRINGNRQDTLAMDKAIDFLATWKARGDAELKNYMEASEDAQFQVKRLSEDCMGIQHSLHMLSDLTVPEESWRAKSVEAINDMLLYLDSSKGKLVYRAAKNAVAARECIPQVSGVIGKADHHLDQKLVLDDARRLVAKGVQPFAAAGNFLLECTRQLFMRRFNTSLMMWRAIAPGGKATVGMNDFAHGIFRIDRNLVLPRDALQVLWATAVDRASTAFADSSRASQRVSQTSPEDRCDRACLLCEGTLRKPLRGVERERLSYPGFTQAFHPAAAQVVRGRRSFSVGPSNGANVSTAASHAEPWLRVGPPKSARNPTMSQAGSPTPDLLGCFLDEAQGMDAQTFRRAVWCGLARECASRINNARMQRQDVINHIRNGSGHDVRGSWHDSQLLMARLMREWHEIQALRGFFGIIVEYPYKEGTQLEKDFEVQERTASRKIENERVSDGALDFAEEDFTQSVVTKVQLGGISHRAGVVVGSRIVSVGLQSATYSSLKSVWSENRVYLIAFVPPDHREGGEALEELLASTKAGRNTADFEKVIRRRCCDPSGKCRYSLRQIHAMWESISAHANFENVRMTRFQAKHALARFGMPMHQDTLDYLFKLAMKNEKLAAQMVLNRSANGSSRSSAFRSVECVSDARCLLGSQLSSSTLGSAIFKKDVSMASSNLDREAAAVIAIRKNASMTLKATDGTARAPDLSECPKCPTCHGWGHTSHAPHLLHEWMAKCHRQLPGDWGKRRPGWSGLCGGQGHHAFQCPGKYQSAEEDTCCQLCLGTHKPGHPLRGEHPPFQRFLARHGPCRACGGIGHWWRVCPHGKVDAVNLHEFNRLRAIYLSDVFRAVGQIKI